MSSARIIKPSNNAEMLAITHKIQEGLFKLATEDQQVYAIIDGAWCHDIYGRLLAYEDLIWCSLISGEQAFELALESPYIVRLVENHPITKWLVDDGWGKGWGFFFICSKARLSKLYPLPKPETIAKAQSRGAYLASPEIIESENADVLQLRRHFRQFSRAVLPDGRVLRFRFFDPYVQSIWLKSAEPQTLKKFTHCLDYLFLEDQPNDPNVALLGTFLEDKSELKTFKFRG